MTKTNPSIDYAKSLETLKRKNSIMKGINKEDPEQLAHGFSYLSHAIDVHARECVDDLPVGLFQSPAIYQDSEGRGAGC